MENAPTEIASVFFGPQRSVTNPAKGWTTAYAMKNANSTLPVCWLVMPSETTIRGRRAAVLVRSM